VLRYLRLAAIQLRASVLQGMQYRADFLVDAAISLFWPATAVVPLFVAFNARAEVQGWSFPETLLVVGWFMLLQGILEGAINPSLLTVVEHIRKGTLDFVLLKPADAQFLVSTAKFVPSRVSNVLAALGLFAYAFARLGRAPSLPGIAAAALLLALSVVLLYSLWILTVSAAFYVVKMDNLTYLFTSLFDAARWPVSVFPRPVAFLFTFVIPLALMTTFPAEALLGRLGPEALLGALVGCVAFSAVARAVWKGSLARYTSASS
jgi:ABC-2 type transport system permease protein